MTRVERDHVAAVLWQTLLATGEDCSGWDGWQHWAGDQPLMSLAREVRAAVRRLRADYDAACDEVSLAPRSEERG